MLRKNKHYSKFRSYTDINNYNNFLIELDKKFTVEKEKEKIQEPITKKTIVPPISIPLLNPYFSGLTPSSLLLNIINDNLDPNLYVEKDNKEKDNKEKDNNKQTTTNTAASSPMSAKTSPTSIKIPVHIDVSINNIDDLLKLIEVYPDDNNC